ncbi:uncharacterized protein [Typha angustifolia]|uniref:uncharacterized protein n=1 Tax=Typha angustifolia TaxID=59011 RepID=UPI003C2D99B1
MARERPTKAPKRKKPRGQNASKTLSSRDQIKKKRTRKTSNPNFIPLGKNQTLAAEEKNRRKDEKMTEDGGESDALLSTSPAAEQLRFFLHCYQTGTKTKLSPLELDVYSDSCMVELTEGVDQNVDYFSDHVKAAFGTSWKEVLCEGKLSEGVVNAGSPALLVISTSALRTLELLRGLKPFTRECRPVKLFAKHMKVEEQATLLKGRVNIACGTPSRIKKLIDMEALSLSCLQVVVLDMQKDAKAFSLFTLPQVRTEFWDLYKSHLEQKVLQGDSRICFYGAVSKKEIKKALQPVEH